MFAVGLDADGSGAESGPFRRAGGAGRRARDAGAACLSLWPATAIATRGTVSLLRVENAVIAVRASISFLLP